MPLIINPDENLLTYDGTIKRLFKDCPKPDGWFGCFFTIAGTTNDIKMTGRYPVVSLNELKEGGKYSVIVQRKENNQYGDSYNVVSITLTPTSETLVKVLSKVKGIGKSTIDKLVYNFGDDSISVIRNEPDKLKDIGLSDKKIALIQESLDSDLNKARLQMLKFCPDLTISKIDRIFEESKFSVTDTVNLFIETAKKNAYLLLDDYSFLGFDFVDTLAMSLTFNPYDKERIIAGIQYVVKCSDEVYIDTNKSNDKFFADVVSLLGRHSAFRVSLSHVATTFTDMVNSNTLPKNLVYKDGYRLYEKHKYDSERYAAIFVGNAVKAKPVHSAPDKLIDDYIDDFEYAEGRKLDDYQRLAVKTALSNRLSLISGGPGRGKSSVAKCIVYVFKRISTKALMLIAPTGKACRRLAEATDERVVETAAHVITQYKWDENHDDSTPAKHRAKLRKGALVIIDETTMIGLESAMTLLNIFEDSQIVFMGDVDQLPSIDYGQFFKDLYMNDKVPHTELMINHRSTGPIAINSDLINAGTHIENTNLTPDGTFTFWNCGVNEGMAADKIIEDYYGLVYDADPDVRKCNMMKACILSPMNKYEAGVTNINMRLQSKLNPNGTPIPELVYKRADVELTPRVGDRVIYTVNNLDAEFISVDKATYGERGLGISNGDCGFITDYTVTTDEIYVTMVTDDLRQYEFNIAECDGNIQLAYAMSIHKSQGSEYDNVLISSQNSLTFTRGSFACKNLMYTAITRAKKSCQMYGSIEAMNKCIDTRIEDKNSYLCQLIYEELR